MDVLVIHPMAVDTTKLVSRVTTKVETLKFKNMHTFEMRKPHFKRFTQQYCG